MTKLQNKFETLLACLLYVTIGTVLAAQVDAQVPPDFKVCFSSRHPRCFELRKTTLVQSLNGMPAHDTTVDAKQAEQVTKAVKDYRSWLESKKTKAPSSLCRNVVTVDLAGDHKELCVSGLPKKEMQEKSKALIELLEAPPKSALKSSK
jgi:hypothetical protein